MARHATARSGIAWQARQSNHDMEAYSDVRDAGRLTVRQSPLPARQAIVDIRRFKNYYLDCENWEMVKNFSRVQFSFVEREKV